MKAITFAVAKGLEDAFDVMTHSPNPNESRFEDRGRCFLIRSERYEHRMRYVLRVTESTPYEVWQAMEIRDLDSIQMVYGEDFAPKCLLVTSGGIEMSFDIIQGRDDAPAPPCRPMVPHRPRHENRCRDHCNRHEHHDRHDCHNRHEHCGCHDRCDPCDRPGWGEDTPCWPGHGDHHGGGGHRPACRPQAPESDDEVDDDADLVWSFQ